MNKRYILGVDGGNTKTDYFLFDTLGNFIDFYRSGTCSHEALKDSFVGAKREMGNAINLLLTRNNLIVDDIEASAYGLAGCDIPSQHESLVQIIKELGLNNFLVVNDSFLGIKAVSQSGACSVCGTGTSAGGIGLDGETLQVGGIGSIVGDEAGGSWLARSAIRATFDYYYRFGKPSSICNVVMDELGISDKKYLMEAIATKLPKHINLTRITKEVFNGANNNDELCIELLKEMANNLARSLSGCVVNLDLGLNPLVIMVGSVFVKGSNDTLVNEFEKLVDKYTNKKCSFVKLTVPPATGAVIWALELATGTYPNEKIRDLITNHVQMKLKEIES